MSGRAQTDRLPSLDRTIELADMVAYGGSTWDWHRLHYDSTYARARGLPGPVVDGQFWGALIALHATSWGGPDVRLAALSLRLRSMVFAGERIHCTGRVTHRESSAVDIAHEIRGADGRVVATGTTRLVPTAATDGTS